MYSSLGLCPKLRTLQSEALFLSKPYILEAGLPASERELVCGNGARFLDEHGSAREVSVQPTLWRCNPFISPDNGRECVKSLRSSYMGLYPQQLGCPRRSESSCAAMARASWKSMVWRARCASSQLATYKTVMSTQLASYKTVTPHIR